MCDSCVNAFEDEGLEPEFAEMAAGLGADIADHICDAFDNGEPCGCSCRSR